MRFSKIVIKIISATLALLCLVSLSSCTRSVFDGVEGTEDELRTVGKIGDYEVLYDELYYLIMSCKDIMKLKYGEDMWKNEEDAAQYENELREMVLGRITANYAVLTLCEDYGFKNVLKNKDIAKSVNSEIDSILYSFALQNDIEVTLDQSMTGKLTYTYEKGGKKKALEYFRAALKDSYLSERVMRLTLATEFAFERLTNILTGEKNEIIYSDADIEEFMFSDAFICTRHVFIQNDKHETVEANRALAEEALAQYKSGSSMDELISSKYNDDVTAPVAGYYFTYSEMDEAYEKAAFALEVGEVSDIVETEDGFFIIERYKKSSSYMLGNIDTFAQQIIYALVNQKVSERQAELALDMNDFGASLEFYKIAVLEESKEEK